MGGDKIGSEQKGAPISGYCGFQAGVGAGNVFGADFVKTQTLAAAHESSLVAAAAAATANPIYTNGDYLRSSTKGREFPDKAPYPEVLRRADRRIAKYGGFVPGVSAENIYGKTFCDSQAVQLHHNKLETVDPPKAEPAWWAKTKPNPAPADGKQKVGYGGFVPRMYAENIHGATFAETQKVADVVDEELKMAQMNVQDVPRDDAPLAAAISQEDHSMDKKVPGYGGYVPGIYAKNVYGATFENAQVIAEKQIQENSYPTASADYSGEAFTVQPNPHISTAQIEGKVKVSGYAGFVPTVASGNVCGETWEDSQFSVRGGALTKVIQQTPKINDAKQMASHTAKGAPPPGPEKHKVPGYAGYVPKIYAQNVYGRTFENSQAIVAQNS